MLITEENRKILEKFDFDTPPVGVKFLPEPPEMLDKLEERMPLCAMLKKAHEGYAFYADSQNHECDAGLYVLGQADVPENFRNGLFGAGLQIYDAPRTAMRLYQHIPTIDKGVVRHVAFAPLAQLNFDPDLMILFAETAQTEILLRALTYRTGQMWVSKYTPAIGCAWIYAYPYLSGELNYTVSGLGHGMRRRKLFPEGRQIISIPFDRLSAILQTLEDMPWVPPAYKPDGLEFVKGLLTQLGLDTPE